MRRSLALIAVLALALVFGSVAAQPSTPPPPSNIWAAQTGARDITLAWNRVPGAIRYRIYEGTGESAKRVGETMASGEQVVRMVTAYGAEHRYWIEAVFENGEVSARIPFNVVVPRELVPGPVASPTRATATATGKGIVVTWDAVPGATAYRITRRTQSAGFRIVCRLCPTETTFLDTTSPPGATHDYSVVAVAPSGASRPVSSNPVTASADQIAAEPASKAAAVAAGPPKGSIVVPPVRGGCLSVGAEGNVAVRLADGTVRFFERVHFERGMKLVPNATFQAVPGISQAVAVVTSGPHTLALLADGTMRAFGLNDDGQLGSAVRDYSGTPVAVEGIGNAVSIAVGDEHSVAVLADGTIRTWGTGERGVPGDGRADVTTDRTKVATVAGISNAKAVAAGGHTTIALLADGSVRAWGSNFGGQGFYGVLGTGDTGNSSATPRPVIGVSNAVAITTSGSGSLALLADGRVMAWGTARFPLITEPETYVMSKRALPVPGIRNAVAVSPYLILLADGTVRDIFRPEVAIAGVANAVAVTSNPTNRYALLEDGRLVGWGMKQFWPKGVVTVAQFDPATAGACSTRQA